MNRIVVFLVMVLSLSASMVRAENAIEQLMQVGNFITKKEHSKAIELAKKLAGNPSNHQAVRMDAYLGLAWAYLDMGKTEEGLDAFQKSVDLGMNNYYAIHQIETFQKYFSNPKFKEIYGKMRISAADMKELMWIYAEIQHINHDINMMITENMNRPDDDYTQVPQSKLPTRNPQSPTILLMREAIKYLQSNQINIVQQSDMQRISHNTNMNIISKMPTGGKSDYDYYKEQQKQQIIQQSKQQAQYRAQQRVLSVQQRQFVLPPGTSTTPEPCPALGSIQTQSSNNNETQRNQNQNNQNEEMLEEPVEEGTDYNYGVEEGEYMEEGEYEEESYENYE